MGRKRASDPLELDLQPGVNHHVSSQPYGGSQSSVKGSDALFWCV
ncbi:hypothetical protein T4D_12306 [Trichinella pseudospiralis]|uniref:Uncharacterized protein n=1 Tax=Trichinella pseudospiralis TaxID=6337 RepID=A0A0V1E3N8_TRIPS|nr:hypothetical protein T4D_12306 [Trichinella pseudospiralis]